MPRKSPATPQPPHLDGALDIQRAIERREELLPLLAGRSKQPIELDLSGVSACDTAGLQLLCAARRSAHSAARPWRLIKSSEAVLRACTEMAIQPEQILI